MEWVPEADALVRIAIAAALGAAVGAERELRGHDAGTRTFAVLCCGAALFTVASVSTFGGANADPTRIVSQVVVGVGFLGAGLIFRQGRSVQNLTTAAALWATAAVGATSGLGEVGLAGAATLLLLVLLLAEPTWVARRLPGRPPQRRLDVRLGPGLSPEDLRALVEAGPGVQVQRLTLGKEAGRVLVQVQVRATGADALESLTRRLVADDGVESMQVQR